MNGTFQPDIDLTKTTPIVCEKCNNDVFEEGVMLRFASRLITFTPKDSLIPIPVFSCKKCGHVNDQFIPSIFKPQE